MQHSDTEDSDGPQEVAETDIFNCMCGAQFFSVKELTEHQIARKHYGCTQCGKVEFFLPFYSYQQRLFVALSNDETSATARGTGQASMRHWHFACVPVDLKTEFRFDTVPLASKEILTKTFQRTSISYIVAASSYT